MSPLPLVIVGCGPAGLAAASVIRRVVPSRELIVLEAGTSLPERRRTIPAHITSGVGGAGLYSDGKFSFYPAASALWRLQNTPRLERSYAWLRELLHSVGVSVPAFMVTPARAAEDDFKPYPSLYIDEPHRYQIIEQLLAPIEGAVWLQSRLLDLEESAEGVRLSIDRSGIRTELMAAVVLLAGGRFSPLEMSHYKTAPIMRFLRIELGLRLEGPADNPFFAELRARGGSLDPKLILRAPDSEWRTFCCCTNGEVIEASCAGFWPLSGRADCAPTGRSNVGINVRLLQPTTDFSLSQLQGRRQFRLSLREVLDGSLLSEVYGLSAATLLREGLSQLVTRFPSLQGEAFQLMGPVIEGVGAYPESDAQLALQGGRLYVAGDACGKFRGLVAALLSGAYLGEVLGVL